MLRVLAVFAVFSILMGWPQSAVAQQDDAASTPEIVRNDLSDKTVRFSSKKHGSGVLYFAQDARAFLWKPGKPEIVIGSWSGETIEIKQGSPKIVTVIEVIRVVFGDGFENRGGIFAFLEANRIHDDLGVVEVSEGDALDLEDGVPPCRICRVDTTFSQMLRN